MKFQHWLMEHENMVRIHPGEHYNANTRQSVSISPEETMKYAEKFGQWVRFVAQADGQVDIGFVSAHGHMPNYQNKSAIHGFINPTTKVVDIKLVADQIKEPFYTNPYIFLRKPLMNMIHSGVVSPDYQFSISGMGRGSTIETFLFKNIKPQVANAINAEKDSSEAEGAQRIIKQNHQNIRKAYANKSAAPHKWFYRYPEVFRDI